MFCLTFNFITLFIYKRDSDKCAANNNNKRKKVY